MLSSQLKAKYLESRWKTLAPLLQAQLSQFGLNPKDWTLIPNYQNHQIKIKLKNKHDRNYRLQGTAEVHLIKTPKIHINLPYWKEITYLEPNKVAALSG